MLTEGRDLLIVTAGYMVHECNKALDALDRAGIDATLVDLYSIPFDADALLDLANENGGNILTVEDNYGGGLGSAVADACTSPATRSRSSSCTSAGSRSRPARPTRSSSSAACITSTSRRRRRGCWAW